MDIYELVTKRKSVRRFQNRPVRKELVERILEAARWAPSWSNKQCWHFIYVDDKKVVSRLSKGAMGRIINAPAYIVACGEPEKSTKIGDKPYYLVDVAIAMEHLILAATAEGLGTCWLVGMFDEDHIKDVLGIPPVVRVVAITPLGYPKEDKVQQVLNFTFNNLIKNNQRKPLVEFLHWGKW